MKLMYYIIILITITTQIFAQSNYDEKIFHPYSGKFALSIDGGVTYSRTDFKNDATKAIKMVIKAFFQNPGT